MANWTTISSLLVQQKAALNTYLFKRLRENNYYLSGSNNTTLFSWGGIIYKQDFSGGLTSYYTLPASENRQTQYAEYNLQASNNIDCMNVTRRFNKSYNILEARVRIKCDINDAGVGFYVKCGSLFSAFTANLATSTPTWYTVEIDISSLPLLISPYTRNIQLLLNNTLGSSHVFYVYGFAVRIKN